ncbi:hypothetical protein BDW02DRAFT_581207 [Decorospora gaudefroyi]|uniref:Uncharacterized protein n=1 Tax=Decorospora gaudefroyi TaxID=184978 RepID=A0A6A5K823_9PLEO|nr:hypothetical protein BDW02DRAFT_581207 [Decorospora gaudefroyi]
MHAPAGTGLNEPHAEYLSHPWLADPSRFFLYADTLPAQPSPPGHPLPPQSIPTPMESNAHHDDFSRNDKVMNRPSTSSVQSSYHEFRTIPPPPLTPPPPPLPTLVPPNYEGYSPLADRTSIQRQTNWAERIQQRQEDIRDLRDELVGSRFRLAQKRRELRTLREKAGVQAGSAFSSIQKFLHERGFNLPDEIASAFSIATSLRDELGLIEADYDEAEDEYDTSEWEYTKKETDFVDTLADMEQTILPAPAGLRVQSEATQGLTHRSQGPSEDWDFSMSEHMPRSSPTCANVDAPDTAVKSPDVLPACGRDFTFKDRTATSLSDLGFSSSGVQKARPIYRSFSETDLEHARLDWPSHRGRLDIWLLDALWCSPLEKVRLRALLSERGLDDDSWWNLVNQHWNAESPPASYVHESDNTPPYAVASHSFPDATVNLPPRTSEYSELGPSIQMTGALVAHDFIIDALEETDIPHMIQPDDFMQSAYGQDPPRIRVRGPSNASSRSAVSALHTSFDAPTSESSLSTGTTEKICTWNNNHNPNEAREDVRLDLIYKDETIRDGSSFERRTAHVGPFERNVEITSTQGPAQPRTYPDNLNVVPFSTFSQHSHNHEPIPSRPYSPISNPDLAPMELDPSRHLLPDQGPLSPPESRSPSPETQRQHPPPSPISATNTSFFLRLTPSPTNSYNCGHSPFMSPAVVEDGLPGPVSDDLFG